MNSKIFVLTFLTTVFRLICCSSRVHDEMICNVDSVKPNRISIKLEDMKPLMVKSTEEKMAEQDQERTLCESKGATKLVNHTIEITLNSSLTYEELVFLGAIFDIDIGTFGPNQEIIQSHEDIEMPIEKEESCCIIQ